VEVVNGQLEARGTFDSEWLPLRLVERAKRGDLYQVSTHVRFKVLEEFEIGESVVINGACVGGPVLVARDPVLVELSVTPVAGAVDRGTYLVIEGTPEYSLCGRGPLPARQKLLQGLIEYERELRQMAVQDAAASFRFDQLREISSAERECRDRERLEEWRAEAETRRANAFTSVQESIRARRRQTP
jgi:hypothetical protein